MFPTPSRSISDSPRPSSVQAPNSSRVSSASLRQLHRTSGGRIVRPTTLASSSLSAQRRRGLGQSISSHSHTGHYQVEAFISPALVQSSSIGDDSSTNITTTTSARVRLQSSRSPSSLSISPSSLYTGSASSNVAARLRSSIGAFHLQDQYPEPPDTSLMEFMMPATYGHPLAFIPSYQPGYVGSLPKSESHLHQTSLVPDTSISQNLNHTYLTSPALVVASDPQAVSRRANSLDTIPGSQQRQPSLDRVFDLAADRPSLGDYGYPPISSASSMTVTSSSPLYVSALTTSSEAYTENTVGMDFDSLRTYLPPQAGFASRYIPTDIENHASTEMLSDSAAIAVRIVDSRPKPQCWDHGCNGRHFSTFSNLLRHQREKSGTASKSSCPRCGAVFTRTTARNGHLAHDKCKVRDGRIDLSGE